MRNRFALSFLWLSLAFLPIACNPKSDDRAAGRNSSQPTNNTGAPNQSVSNATAVNSGGGVLVTFKPDSSGNTASRLLTITDAAGIPKSTYLCEDTLFNCDLFEKAKSVTTSNCDSNNNCSGPTKVESIPTCTKESGFVGNINQEMNEIAALLYDLGKQKREGAEKFIAYNKETYEKLENKETNVATQIKAVSKMHPCDFLAQDKEFMDALAELSLNGEVDPEMIAGLVIGTLGASAVAIATGVVTIQELRKGGNPEQFLKILKEAQDTAKTNLAKADAELTKLQTDKAAELKIHAEAKKALTDAKSNFKFTDSVLRRVEFNFKTVKINKQSDADYFKKLATLSEIDFQKLTPEEKTFLKTLTGGTSEPKFDALKGLQEEMQKNLKDYKKSVQDKLTELNMKENPDTEDKKSIKRLKDAGVKTKTEWDDLKKNNELAVKFESDFTTRENDLKAKQLAAKIDLELTTAVNDLGKYNKFSAELKKIEAGNSDDFKKVVLDFLGDDSEFYKTIKDLDSSKFSSSVAESMKKLTSRVDAAKNVSVDKVKAVFGTLGDLAKMFASTARQATAEGKAIAKAFLVGGEEEETELTPDQKVIADYVLKAVDFAEEFAKNLVTQDTLQAQIAALLSQSLQASTPAALSNPQ